MADPLRPDGQQDKDFKAVRATVDSPRPNVKGAGGKADCSFQATVSARASANPGE
jgi:hypothetical protein